MSIDLTKYRADLAKMIEKSYGAPYEDLKLYFIHLVEVTSYLIGFIEGITQEENNE